MSLDEHIAIAEAKKKSPCKLQCSMHVFLLTIHRILDGLVMHVTHCFCPFLLWEPQKRRRRRKMLINYTYMLLSVRQDLPEAREKLDPGPFSQRCGDVTELNQGV